MSFLANENSSRLKAYRKDQSEEVFIQSLNEIAKDFESQREIKESAFPWIFVTGLPRSGTTLLMQCLASAFEFCFVNNFMARFWRAPVVGARMSRILLNQTRFISDFKSDYGKTSKIDDVHEWSYFWIEKLNYSRNAAFNRNENIDAINWPEINSILNQLTAVFEKPFLNKALHPVKYVKQFLEINPDILFIHIERDFQSNCQSVLNARQQYYGNPDEWWSVIPDNYSEIEHMPYYEQIPLQLNSLSSEMKHDLKTFAEGKTMYINYHELCANPREVMNEISIKLKTLFSTDYSFDISVIPKEFKRLKQDQADLKLKNYVNRNF